METGHEMPRMLELANEKIKVGIITMLKDAKENLLPLTEKKGHFNM